ncbi:MAG: hypothetical protein K6F39_06670 [Lachnospiraceae bacterium]|nr:hypothetical protein [Lachnospiraceae bacterium]
MIESWVDTLRGKSIKDFIAVGAVDIEDGIAEFLRDLRFLYIEFEVGYLRLESVMQYSMLKIGFVEEPDYDYEIDEDMVKAKESIAEIVLENSLWLGNEINKITLYDYDCKTGYCAAMKLELSNGQIIFIDPSYYFGIKVGGSGQEKIWEENYINAKSIRENVYNLN